MRRLAITLLFLLAFGSFAIQAKAQPNLFGRVDPFGLRVCKGQFALCAASICTPTGGQIAVNVPGGGTTNFPAATCICPVVQGPNIADVNGGNMKGSCDPPGKGMVWSTYQERSNVPQEINKWSRQQTKSAIEFQLCPASLGVGNQFANCWSFACTINKNSKSTNGVKTATCTCPLGENPDATAVPADTAVLTPAGQCNEDVCSEHPVGAAPADAGSDPYQCLADQNSSSAQSPDAAMSN